MAMAENTMSAPSRDPRAKGPRSRPENPECSRDAWATELNLFLQIPFNVLIINEIDLKIYSRRHLRPMGVKARRPASRRLHRAATTRARARQPRQAAAPGRVVTGGRRGEPVAAKVSFCEPGVFLTPLIQAPKSSYTRRKKSIRYIAQAGP
jgi:hypothetical protein